MQKQSAEAEAEKEQEHVPPAGAASPPPASGPSGETKPRRVRKPKEHHPEARALVLQFREDYRDNVDQALVFGPVIPEAELAAATRFLSDPSWSAARLHELKVAVMLDKCEPRPGNSWRGWAGVVRSVAKLWDKRDDLEASLVRGV